MITPTTGISYPALAATDLQLNFAPSPSRAAFVPSFTADWSSLLASPFFLRSLIVAVLVGLSAPIIGTYLVLSLIHI